MTLLPVGHVGNGQSANRNLWAVHGKIMRRSGINGVDYGSRPSKGVLMPYHFEYRIWSGILSSLVFCYHARIISYGIGHQGYVMRFLTLILGFSSYSMYNMNDDAALFSSWCMEFGISI